MRTLQRLGHGQGRSATPAGPPVAPSAAQAGRRPRRRTLRILLGAALGLVVATAAVVWVVGGRVVADGLSHGNVVVVTAPAPVRVAEVLLRPGQRCRRGDPLLRLEALSRREERRALELAVEQRRVRLALARAGAELEGTDLARRGDLVAQAEQEVRLAEADLQVARARQLALVQQKETLLLTLEQDRLGRGGEMRRLREKLAAAEADVARAEAERNLAEFEAEASADLQGQGVVSERDAREAATGEDAASREVDEQAAESRALRNEVETAERLDALEPRRSRSSVEEMDARIEAADKEVDATRVRRDLWQDLAERRRRLFPAVEDADELRELEVRLLQTELFEAEARLASLDEQTGRGLIRAETDGVVDQVFVAAGHAVAAGAELASYYDPSTQWVVAYVEPEGSRELRAGLACRVVPEGSDEALEGLVTSLASSWVPCPQDLPRDEDRAADLRLAVRIECADPQQTRSLRPRMRVRVVFTAGR